MPEPLKIINYGLVKGEKAFKIQMFDESSSIQIPGAGSKNFRIDLDGGSIYAVDTTGGSTEPDTLILALRTLDYCDDNGDKKKIIVLASQPFNAED